MFCSLDRHISVIVLFIIYHYNRANKKEANKKNVGVVGCILFRGVHFDKIRKPVFWTGGLKDNSKYQLTL